MSSLPVRASESPFYEPFHTQTASYANVTKTISTLALLLLGYYGLSFLDAWPSTLKRSTYECVLYFTPSHLIYAMQYGLVRLGYLGQEDAKFKHANFGDMIAKQEARTEDVRTHTIAYGTAESQDLFRPSDVLQQ